jgi:hypothetical protein
MKASRLVQTEEISIIFEGDEPVEDRTLNLTVNPGKLTPAQEAAIRAADDNATEPLVDLILDIVEKWDLLSDEGEVIPLTKDSLMNQPIIVLGMVLNGVSEELQKQAQEQGKASAGT